MAVGSRACESLPSGRWVGRRPRRRLGAGCTHLDLAMNLSEPHPERPHELTGVKLGDRQFVRDEERRNRGLLALVGIGVEPGLSDAFARYASDELFSELDEVGVRDAAIHRRPEDTAQAGSRFGAADRGAGSRGGAARRGCGRPARSGDARQPHARADVRRHLHRGAPAPMGSPDRRTSTTSSTTSTRCGSGGTRRSSCRPR